MFQPGEEGFHGARHMIDEGVLDGVAAGFALHVSPNLPAGTLWTKGGPLMASADVLDVVVKGKGGHASTPYLANDPMPVAAEMVQALQTLVTRRVNTFDPVVVSITRIRAGTTNNVIPESVEMTGTLRAVSEEQPQVRARCNGATPRRHRVRTRHGRRAHRRPGLSRDDERRRVRRVRAARRGRCAG